jgi:hypothetical protein
VLSISVLFDLHSYRAEPGRLSQTLLDRMGALMRKPYDWSADVAKLTMPVMPSPPPSVADVE